MGDAPELTNSQNVYGLKIVLLLCLGHGLFGIHGHCSQRFSRT